MNIVRKKKRLGQYFKYENKFVHEHECNEKMLHMIERLDKENNEILRNNGKMDKYDLSYMF